MRWIAYALLFGGCDSVFGLDEVEPADALCLGRNTEGGLLDHCLTAQPPPDLDGLIDINTDDPAACTAIVAQADLDQTEVCLIAARTITIRSPVIARGTRPLVLAAVDSFEVTANGRLSAASHRQEVRGPGANFGRCANNVLDGRATTVTTSGGAGGAGGSFQTLGGQGGAGNGNANNVQPVSEPAPGFVRGGCPGGVGGKGVVSMAGERGIGGGALYILADAITIAGVLDASGEGGGFGGSGVVTQSGGGGGGGGGSGGMLGLDAPRIVLTPTAKLLANGGGGGGGGASTQPGKSGFEADPTMAFPFVAVGGDGGSGVGGPGGDGATVEAAAEPGANYSGAGGDAGGGGGGGLGYIMLFGGVDDQGAAITPAPS